MRPEVSIFFKETVNAVKADSESVNAINALAEKSGVRIMSLKTSPLYAVVSFDKVAYQIRYNKKKTRFECAAFGVTKI